jgi:hypothetical protein
MFTKRIIKTREAFFEALSLSQTLLNGKAKNTKFGWYCEQFLDLNEQLSKAHNKGAEKLTKSLKLELQKFRIEHALEKDGKLVLDEKHNYTYDRKGELAVFEKQEQITDKITEAVEKYFKENVEVICITSEFKDLPEFLTYGDRKTLSGFVYSNKSEFTEEIISQDKGTKK